MSNRISAAQLPAPLVIVLGLAIAPVSRGAEVPQPAGVTLEAARAKALEANPELSAGAADVRAAAGALRQARALPDPEISFEAEDFGGNLPDEATSQRTLSVSERVEWFGKRASRVEAARRERDLAGHDLELRRLDVLQEVEKRFVDLLAAQERLAIAGEDAATAAEVRAAVSALVSAGEASPIEETRALGEESLARVEKDRAARDVALAGRALSRLWGEASRSVPRADGRLEAVVAVPERATALAALGRLPDLARWDAETARLEALEELSRRQALPDLTLTAGLRSLVGTGQRTWVAGITVPIPLPGATSGARSEAAARLEAARAGRLAEEVRLRTAWLSAEEELRHASNEVRLLTDVVLPNAHQTWAALSEGYRRGKFRLLDLLEARRALAASHLRLVDALARLNSSLADLRRLTPDGLLARAGESR